MPHVLPKFYQSQYNAFRNRYSIVVLEFEKNLVVTYDWTKDPKDSDALESFIIKQGHNIEDIQWGIFQNENIDIVHETKKVCTEKVEYINS